MDVRFDSRAVVIGLGTILVQVRSAIRLKDLEARTAFELKAAELVLNAYSPYAAYGRAKILKDLFPHRLPAGFPELFNREDFPGVRLHEMKIELLRSLAEHPDRKEEIVGAWRTVFPSEDFIQKL